MVRCVSGVCVTNFESNLFVLCNIWKNPMTGLLSLPGGKVEDHETLEQALIREFKEETGL